MKEIVVISGKGGTGKTSLTASFAALAEKVVVADCDVDAADLHLVLGPKIKHEEEFSGGKVASVIAEECTGCGKCYELCRFGAVSRNEENDRYSVDPVACEGCGVCAWFCPEKAVAFEPAVNGKWFVSDTRYGPMVHAKLGVAEENSGKLVTLVRNQARQIAEKKGASWLIVDGAPGIGCPVIASITGADLVVIVTEPTVSGEHDLERVSELASHFNIPAAVCINKSDINEGVSARIVNRSNEKGLKVVGAVRYDTAVTKAQTARAAVVEYTGGAVVQDIRSVWRHIVYAAG